MSPARDISYLSRGTANQQRAHQCLSELKIIESLAQYDPMLVGAVCLDIETPQSDLDIVCEAYDVERFEHDLRAYFGNLERFSITRSSTDPKAMVCQFFFKGLELEIFGAPLPIESQNGYLHFIQIDRSIRLAGSAFRERLRALKCAGMKTEPALATLLSLEGDPYQAVLGLRCMTDDEIVTRAGS